MKFAPVPITGGPTDGQPVLFSIWDTRVRDFAQFIEESGYDMTKGETAYTLEFDGKGGGTWKQAGGNWRDPHFSAEVRQTEDHPVVCVSWEDANAFVNGWRSGSTKPDGWRRNGVIGCPAITNGVAQWELVKKKTRAIHPNQRTKS